MQNEHGEVHIDHDFKTVTTKLPSETTKEVPRERSPRKERKPRERKPRNRGDVKTDASTAELNSDSTQVDASMLNYGATANSSEQPVVVFIDGACTNNGTQYAKAGYGAFFGQDDTR